MSEVSRKQRLEQMLTEMPDDMELRYMLAMEHISEGDDNGAVVRFAELRSRDPNYPPAYHMEARTLVRLGRIDEARNLLTTGIEVARKRGDFHAAGEMTELLESLQE